MDQTADATKSLWELFQMGGWAMWPLLIFSVITISLIIERVIYFILHNLSTKKVLKNVMDFLDKNEITKAVEYCNGLSKRLVSSEVLLQGLKMAELGEHRMEKAIESEAAAKINEMERGFSILVALGSLAPINGFLGTVSGMIGAFQKIAYASDVSAKLVANGIFEALITTAYGLAIAIVAIAGYNLFSHFVDKFTADIEEAGSTVITAILLKDKK